jgi:hypothetical protein
MHDDASDFITIVDNHGNEKRQRIEYTISDVQGEIVYVTDGGLRYIQDSLWAKRHQRFLLEELDRLPDVISNADIVVWDSMADDDTLLYYKHLYIASQGQQWLVVAVVKIRQNTKFLYNFHLQESGKVKGYHLDMPPEIWYLNPQQRKRTFGL